MLVKDNHNKLSPISIALHWIVAVMIIGLLISGLYMTNAQNYSLYPWHKSFGVLVSLFVVLRIFWRIMNGFPVAIGKHSKIENFLARLVHYLLIIGTVIMPLSGILMSAMGGHGVSLFGVELIAGVGSPINTDIAMLANKAHFYSGYIIIGSLLMHVIGALKHHFIDKDLTLKRMIGKI